MSEFFYAAILIVFALITWALLYIWMKRDKERRQKLNNIYAVITVSNIISISDISRTLGLGTSETRELLNKLIEEAKHNKDYKLLKNAYINFHDDKVILDPNARDNIIYKTVDTIVSSFMPKKDKKIDWTCTFCNTINKAHLYNCNNCGAGRLDGQS